ncbi:pullulanase [Vibrio galatheae]|uniref:Pullulanase n=1 Tax=Vibrio galatheae TaxID=579748 RepID=A0A0F4NGA6_9VIBR|nr:hypothetical protein [Vibrio galatheae]KJY82145.1 pullulanase [Vibrio galatheae]
MAIQYCEKCGKETEHKELIKQKPSKYGKSRKEKFKEFLSGFLAGVAVGPALASIELIDRYVVCQECGHKKLENHGEEFQ